MAECFGTIAGWTRCSRPLSVIQRDAEELDAVAEVVGRLDAGLTDRSDALDVDLVEGDPRSERQAGQQRQLVGSVEAVHVEGRVGLGVALLLGLLEDIAERAVLLPASASGCSCRCR